MPVLPESQSCSFLKMQCHTAASFREQQIPTDAGTHPFSFVVCWCFFQSCFVFFCLCFFPVCARAGSLSSPPSSHAAPAAAARKDWPVLCHQVTLLLMPLVLPWLWIHHNHGFHGMCQCGEEATEVFPSGTGRSWDWDAATSLPCAPHSQQIPRYVSFYKRATNHRDFLRRKLYAQGVKFLTFSSCQWHLSTVALMLLTWPWLLQDRGVCCKAVPLLRVWAKWIPSLKGKYELLVCSSDLFSSECCTAVGQCDAEQKQTWTTQDTMVATVKGSLGSHHGDSNG